jgi:hypothetical protein
MQQWGRLPSYSLSTLSCSGGFWIGLWGRKLTLGTRQSENLSQPPRMKGFLKLHWGTPSPTVLWGLGYSGIQALPTAPRQVLLPHLAGVGRVKVQQRALEGQSPAWDQRASQWKPPYPELELHADLRWGCPHLTFLFLHPRWARGTEQQHLQPWSWASSPKSPCSGESRADRQCGLRVSGPKPLC